MGIVKQHPYVIFPALRVMENTVKKDGTHITFKAVEEGTKVSYIFNAFDSSIQKISRLDFKNAGRVVINSEMKCYLDSNNQMRYSFTVLSIRFIDNPREDISFDRKEKPEEPVKKNQNLPEQKTQAASDDIDMEALHKMFS